MAGQKKTSTAAKTSSAKAKTEEAVSTINVTADDTVKKAETSETESPIVSFRAKKTIPMDAMVMVKSNVHGRLVYASKRLQGYKEVWAGYGEEIPMEMAELYSMKSTDRAFFTENWIEVDPVVLRDLQMQQYYDNAVSANDMDKLFSMPTDKLEAAIDSMKENARNALALEAIERVENGKLTDIRIISTIEKKLDCELYEH